MNLKVSKYIARESIGFGRKKSGSLGYENCRTRPTFSDLILLLSLVRLPYTPLTSIFSKTKNTNNERLYSTFSPSIYFHCVTKNKRILYPFSLFLHTTSHLFLDILYNARGNQLGSKQGTDIATIRTKMIDGRGNGKSS